MMFRRFLIFAVLCLWLAPIPASAGHFSNLPKSQAATGTIKNITQNYLYLIEDPDGFIRRFLYDVRGNTFKAGDRVRIYYSTFRNTIELIKLMTPLEYKEDGQNLGYITKKSDHP